MTIEEVMATLYPDITSGNTENIAPERMRQYDRDFKTLSENFDQFSHHLGDGKTIADIGHALHYVLYDNLHEKLCPGFKQLSVTRQETFAFKAGICNLKLRDLDFVAAEMATPESELYLPGYDESALINIAANYVKTIQLSHAPVEYETGRMEHVPDGDWFDAQPEKALRAPNAYEKSKRLHDAVKSFQRKESAKILLSKIMGKAQDYTITTDRVVQAYRSLEASRTVAEQSHETKKAEVEF